MNTYSETEFLVNPDPVNSSRKPRLIGLDYFRVLATYGVVYIHGLGGVPRDTLALQLNSWFSAFCVPFFFASSFWLLDQKLDYRSAKAYLRARTLRLLLPFFSWSLIYLLARLGKQIINEDQSLNKILDDPIHLLFGSASVQLYFLPMLLVGTIVAVSIKSTIKDKPAYIPISILLLVASLGLRAWLIDSGNTFSVSDGMALKNLLSVNSAEQVNWFVRLCAVVIAWVILCLPYALAAPVLKYGLLGNLDDPSSRKKILIISGITLVASIPVFFHFGNFPLGEFFLAYSAMLLGISSPRRVSVPWLNAFAKASFGIYLIHALLTESLVPIFSKLLPVLAVTQLSLETSLFFSILIFFMSFLLTQIIALNRTARTVLLGE